MTTQLSLLDRAWCQQSAPVVLSAMRGKRWSADDLHGLLPEPEEKNLFGVLVAKLRCSGQIKRVGSEPSKRPEANGRHVGIYENV